MKGEIAMSDTFVKQYAIRMARKQAKEFITKHLVDMGNDAMLKMVDIVMDELSMVEPATAFDLDFAQVLNTVK